MLFEISYFSETQHKFTAFFKKVNSESSIENTSWHTRNSRGNYENKTKRYGNFSFIDIWRLRAAEWERSHWQHREKTVGEERQCEFCLFSLDLHQCCLHLLPLLDAITGTHRSNQGTHKHCHEFPRKKWP